ncbi:CocE/NonD family hydrolase [Actinomadura nitritigenes]|uniref:CocE/NonD family hydrolase n=1 Tax=Actinomadura nitritigenes TaxID=134602 RepID=UPI003D8B80EE
MPIEFETITEEPVGPFAVQHLVRMRDGVRLATDVYLPEGWEQGPVILTRLPYDKNSRYVFFDRVAALFNARGYAVVVQDVRGKFRSEGETVAALNEVNDGYDTIDWIVRQSWSDGKVGMFGDSYYGYTQWAAVASEHPALRAIVPRVTGADIGRFGGDEQTVEEGAARRLTTLWTHLYLSQIWVDRYSYDFVPDFSLRPVSAIFEDVFESIGGRSAAYDALHSPSPIPRTFPGPHPFDTKPIPVLHVAGWFDNLKETSIGDFLRLSARPAWAPLQYLLVDSIDHENYRLADVPIIEETDHGVNEEALSRMLAGYVGPAADFFDVFLSETRSASSLPRVRWHLGHGPDEFQMAESWPPTGVTTTELYLGDAQRATTDAAGGILAETEQPESAVTWTHDPDDLVPGTVANPFAILFELPDETPISGRPDVLTFTSDVRDADLDLVGPAEATLLVDSEAPTADIVAKLLDVAPDGRATLIAWGDAEADTADGSRRFTVSLGHVGYRVRAGHALRLQLAGSEFPQFLPNPGTDESRWEATETKARQHTLTTDAGTALRLSVRPALG